MPSLKSLGRLKHSSLQDVMWKPGSRGCKVCTNRSCLGPCCLSFGNLSNRKVFSSPNNILSMQVVFFFLMTFAKPWLLSCHECCQGLWKDPAPPPPCRSWLLTGRWPLLESLCSMSRYEVSVMKRGTRKLKKAMVKRKLISFLQAEGRKTEVNSSRIPAAQDATMSVLDSEWRHPILDMRSY